MMAAELSGSRRGLFAGVLATAGVAAIPLIPDFDPDGQLLVACAAFQRSHAETEAADNAHFEEWLDERTAWADRIEDTPAVTLQGRLAKAGVALVLLEEACDFTSDFEKMALSALRDVAGRA
jgi:hypothetical protein